MGKNKLILRLISAFVAIFFAFAREAPSYSQQFMPETDFTCQGKANGAFYADVEAECQLYHVCSRNEDGVLEDIKFLCGNGTVFDQRRLVCQDFRRVRCYDAPRFYRNVAIRPKKLQARTQEDDRYLLVNANLDLEAPSYSMEFLPETRFTCKGKVNGGYYADVEAQCQLYHICSRNKDGVLQDIKFLCGNETVFDQKKLVCQDFRKVRCHDAPRFYRNVATLLEELEARRRTDEDNRQLLANANLDLEAPSYSMEFLPETYFTCKGKRNGGYYADVEAQCQLYHVCSRNKHGILEDIKFLCGNETVFDQERLVCQDFRKVRCHDAPHFYRT